MVRSIKNNNRKCLDENHMFKLTLSGKHWCPHLLPCYQAYRESNFSFSTCRLSLRTHITAWNHWERVRGVSEALIRRSYLYSDSTDSRALRTSTHCNLHHFQEPQQMQLHIPAEAPHEPLHSHTHKFGLCFFNLHILFIFRKTWDIGAHKVPKWLLLHVFWELNRFSQIGCITTRAAIQAGLQSHRLQLEHRPRDTSIEGESLHTFKGTQWTGGETVTRHTRDLQAISKH